MASQLTKVQIVVPVQAETFMPTVEIRIASAQIVGRMDEVRRWLRERGCTHRLTSTGSRDERVVVVEFISGADAAEFARYFRGNLVVK
jgi:hypothetical protein